MNKKIAEAVRSRKVRALTAAALAVGLLLALTVGAAGAGSHIDLTQPCSLTITPGTYDDMDEAEVVIDLYKVASAVADETYDTYSYQLETAYSSLGDALSDLSSMQSSDWRDLASEAAELTLGGDNVVAKTVDGAAVADGAVEDLEAGLYLLIARGADITDYIDENDEGSLITLAHSDHYIYSYLPELISVPSTASLAGDPEQTIMTSDGEWLYDLEVMLKPSQAIRFGSIEIDKTLNACHDGYAATFVYTVEAYDKNNVLVYSNAVPLTMTAAGTGSVQVDRIPVGARVVVTEVFTGTGYELVSEAEAETVVHPVEIGTVAFTNTIDGTSPQGGAISNEFDKQEDGWHHTPVYSNVVAER